MGNFLITTSYRIYYELIVKGGEKTHRYMWSTYTNMHRKSIQSPIKLLFIPMSPLSTKSFTIIEITQRDNVIRFWRWFEFLCQLSFLRNMWIIEKYPEPVRISAISHYIVCVNFFLLWFAQIYFIGRGPIGRVDRFCYAWTLNVK